MPHVFKAAVSLLRIGDVDTIALPGIFVNPGYREPLLRIRLVGRDEVETFRIDAERVVHILGRARIRDEVVPNLSDVVENWEFNFNPSDDPDQYYDSLYGSVKQFIEEFGTDAEGVEQLEDALQMIDGSIEVLRERYPGDDSDDDDYTDDDDPGLVGSVPSHKRRHASWSCGARRREWARFRSP